MMYKNQVIISRQKSQTKASNAKFTARPKAWVHKIHHTYAGFLAAWDVMVTACFLPTCIWSSWHLARSVSPDLTHL